MFWQEFLGTFTIVAGFIIGLGATTVIDWHGLLGRKSTYWTEATIRTHKVTKPLIWVGAVLVMIGWLLINSDQTFNAISLAQVLFFGILVLNGCFLSLYISPLLIKREKEGKSSELLPSSLQTMIAISFLVSFVFWWSEVLLFVWQLLIRYYDVYT